MTSESPGPSSGQDQQGTEPAPPPQTPAAPTPAPAQPAWGAPPPPQAAPPQGQWGAPPQGQWGAPPAYGAPPPQGAQGPGAAPGWAVPGGQPGWQGGPPPAKSGGGGCIKACLIVGVILVILAIVAFLLLWWAGSSFVGGLGIDSSGNLKDCSIVSSKQLQPLLGPDTEAHPLSGLANTALGLTLDKRVLADADNCYVLSGASDSTTQASGGYGRIAKYSGLDASSVFDKEQSGAKTGQYFAIDVPGAGDQAFCTGWSEKFPATGALVRKGNDLVYVSFLIGADFGSLDFTQTSTEAGVPFSPKACDIAISVAELALH